MPVVITQEEKALPYAKYFYQDLAPIPQEKLDIWHGPMADPALATPVERRNDFLEEGKVALKVGFTVAPNGTGFVANSTFMPGVTPEMFLWWFAWHCVGPDLRYKIWDRDDHLQARAIQADYVRDPAVPWAETTWGVTHDIMEDIGLGMERLLLQFCKPSDLGYDMSKIGTPACAAMVCAVGKSSSPALMTHKVVPAEGGVWFKSHVWMGYGLDGAGQLVKLVPDGHAVPEMVPRALFGHNIKEFSNLAAILPSLYGEERDRLWGALRAPQRLRGRPGRHGLPPAPAEPGPGGAPAHPGGRRRGQAVDERPVRPAVRPGGAGAAAGGGGLSGPGTGRGLLLRGGPLPRPLAGPAGGGPAVPLGPGLPRRRMAGAGPGGRLGPGQPGAVPRLVP